MAITYGPRIMGQGQQKKKSPEELAAEEAQKNRRAHEGEVRFRAKQAAEARESGQQFAGEQAGRQAALQHMIAYKDREGVDPQAVMRLYGAGGGGAGGGGMADVNERIRQRREALYRQGVQQNIATGAADRSRIAGNIQEHQQAQSAYDKAKASGADEATLSRLRAAAVAASTRLPRIGHAAVGGEYSTYNPKIASPMSYKDPDTGALSTIHGVALNDDERNRFMRDKGLGAVEGLRAEQAVADNEVRGLKKYMDNLRGLRQSLAPEMARDVAKVPAGSAIMAGGTEAQQRLQPTVEDQASLFRRQPDAQSEGATTGYRESANWMNNRMAETGIDLVDATQRLQDLFSPERRTQVIDQSQSNQPMLLSELRPPGPAASPAPAQVATPTPATTPPPQPQPTQTPQDNYFARLWQQAQQQAGAVGPQGPAGPAGAPAQAPMQLPSVAVPPPSQPNPFAGASAEATVPGAYGPATGLNVSAGPAYTDPRMIGAGANTVGGAAGTAAIPQPQTVADAATGVWQSLANSTPGGYDPQRAALAARTPPAQASAPAAAAPAATPPQQPNPYAPTPGTNPMDPYNLMLADFARTAAYRARQPGPGQGPQQPPAVSGDTSAIMGRPDEFAKAGKALALKRGEAEIRQIDTKNRAIDEAIGGSEAVVKKGDAALAKHSDIPARIQSDIEAEWGEINEGILFGTDEEETKALADKLETQVARLSPEQKLAIKRYFADKGKEFADKVSAEIKEILGQWLSIGGSKAEHAKQMRRIYEILVTGGMSSQEAASVSAGKE